jgi:hypothetical protein
VQARRLSQARLKQKTPSLRSKEKTALLSIKGRTVRQSHVLEGTVSVITVPPGLLVAADEVIE